MKHIVFYLVLLPISSFCQKHDYIWVAGDDNTTATNTHGGIVIDYNKKPVSVSYNYRKTNMFICNSSICDTNGNLLCYTNGCVIAGADDEVLENGDNINPGGAHQLRCVEQDRGYASGIQSALFLP